MSNVKIIAQYIKNLSFEIPEAPQVFLSAQEKPEINLSINIDAKKIAAASEENPKNDIFEITLEITANAASKKNKNFICKVAYSGIFSIQSNIETEILEQILLIYCPNLLFPFIRRIVTNATIDGGFPPLMIDPIDFTELYNKRKAAAAAQPVNDTKN